MQNKQNNLTRLSSLSRRDFSLGIFAMTTAQLVYAQAAQPAPPTEEALWDDLRKGGYVLLIRHADAPGTFDPPGFKLGVCSTQRNLSEEGRAQSTRLGELFRSKNVPIAQVFSSEWCRCIDTATLAFGAANVKTWRAISSPRGGDEKQRQANLEAVRQRIAQASLKTNMALVTHMFNIQDIIGQGAAQGEIVVLRAQDKQLRVVGRIAT
jgi:phosphohistidine phosphatase SixA